MKLRSLILWGAAAVTAVAVWWAPQPTDEAVQPVTRATRIAEMGAPPRAGAKPDDALVVLELRPRARDDLTPGLFRAHKTAPPLPPPKLAPAAEFRGPPLPPTAPPLPFKVIGHAIDDGRMAVFLQYNEQSLIARAGDLLIDQYKVEQVSDAAVVLTFLPLNQRQTLDLAAAPR